MGLINQLEHRVNRWQIVSLDPEVDLVIESQFQPEGGLRDQQDPTTASSSSTGSAQPAVQWVSGGQRRLALSGTYRSLNFAHDLRPQIALLRRLREADPALGRAPRVLLTWREVRLAGWVHRCSITIGARWVSGLPKIVTYEIEVGAAAPIGVEADDPSTRETLYTELVDGETFETLGARHLGDPLRGELIRRENPELAAGEAAGDRVKLLEREHPRMRGAVRPSSPAFLRRYDGTDPWHEVLAELAESRGTGAARGLPYRLLPEVLAGEV